MLEPDRPASSPSQDGGGADEGGEDGDGDAALASEREAQVCPMCVCSASCRFLDGEASIQHAPVR